VPFNATQEAPRASTRATGWPVRRAPRWVWLAGAGLLVIAVAVALVHKPTQGERASDMRGFLQDVTSDIQSCAGGVSESLTALRIVQAEHFRSSTDVSQGISVAQQGAANCSPANNEQIDDLENYQVPQSLDSFGLIGAVSNLVDWAAPGAEQVMTDIAQVLSASTPQARSSAEANLSAGLAALNAKRQAIEVPINKAIKVLAIHSARFTLPG
jgi:hypothetical protein